MKRTEDPELDEVAGAAPGRNTVFDVVERVLRASQRMPTPLSGPTGF